MFDDHLLGPDLSRQAPETPRHRSWGADSQLVFELLHEFLLEVYAGGLVDLFVALEQTEQRMNLLLRQSVRADEQATAVAIASL